MPREEKRRHRGPAAATAAAAATTYPPHAPHTTQQVRRHEALGRGSARRGGELRQPRVHVRAHRGVAARVEPFEKLAAKFVTGFSRWVKGQAQGLEPGGFKRWVNCKKIWVKRMQRVRPPPG